MSTGQAYLITALRELRDRTGLSLAALAERTTYSKSSWERYLNGKTLPPRQAVEELCRVADEPEGRLTALWEIAVSDRSGRARVLSPVSEEPQPTTEKPRAGSGRRRSRRGRLLVMMAAAYTVIAAVAVLALVLPPGRDSSAGAAPSDSASYSVGPQCNGPACEGKDPMRLICGINPASLTTYRTSTGAHVELRHSNKCGASWARVWGTRIGDRVEVTAGGPVHEVRIANQDDTETYVYTDMAAAHAGSTVRACFWPAASGGGPECVRARVGEASSAVLDRRL
ncbi:DUF2690 domain-containing protein [Streptomyces sp. NPDC089424]|uniref:helix-turn-helix domain-containing protein n=1 Tax=Streptomyces sp. NPDC089424 TaxID=3365917 RepID=UPI00382ED652